MLGVLLDERPIVPEVVRRNVNWNKVLYGHMRVCPFTPERAGWMRHVCIESVRSIRVEERTKTGRETTYHAGPWRIPNK